MRPIKHKGAAGSLGMLKNAMLGIDARWETIDPRGFVAGMSWTVTEGSLPPALGYPGQP